MKQKHFTDKDIMVGRVVNEDDNFMLLEVCKDENRQLRLEEGDKFYTIIFTAGKPWE